MAHANAQASKSKGPDDDQMQKENPLRLPTAVLIEDPRYRIKPAQQVISALAGGLITTFVVTPLEVVKTRVQTQNTMRQRQTVSKLCYVFHNGLMTHICKPSVGECLSKTGSPKPIQPLRGAMDAFVKIICGNGVTGLWAGLSPTLVSALPSTVIYFLTYEHLKNVFANLYHRHHFLDMENGMNGGGVGSGVELKQSTGVLHIPSVVPMLAGICSRTAVVTAVTPIEMVRIKMQSGHVTYTELWLVVRSLVRKHGLKGLWRGWPPTVMRDAPFSGTYWAAYESMKHTFDVTEPTFKFSFIAGAVSGALATWVTMPFDLITTHTQLELGQDVLSSDAAGKPVRAGSATSVAPTVWSRLISIYMQHGLRGLYVGVMPRMLRVVPACAIMISTFEYSKSFFFRYNLDLQETGMYRRFRS